MTLERKSDFLQRIREIEDDRRLEPSQNTRAICLLCRILLDLAPVDGDAR